MRLPDKVGLYDILGICAPLPLPLLYFGLNALPIVCSQQVCDSELNDLHKIFEMNFPLFSL